MPKLIAFASVSVSILLAFSATGLAAGKSSGPARAGHGALLDATPDGSAPDPLAPPDIDSAAPIAPGAPAAVLETAAAPGSEPAAAVEPGPVVAAVLARFAEAPKREDGGEKADRAGILAFYKSGNGQPIWVSDTGLSKRAEDAIAEIGRADDWGLVAAAFELPHAPEVGATTPGALAEIEAKLSVAVLKYARAARGGRVNPSSITRLFDQKPRPYEPKSVLQGIAASEAADAYLRGLHPKHPQFEQLRQALARARGQVAATALTAQGASGASPAKAPFEARNASLARRIVANMERWRWMPDQLGDFYVWDNVPEEVTRVYDKGKEKLVEKIVVGQPSTPTPIFSANMQFIIFHPDWGVPDGIKANELGPKLRAAGQKSWSLFGGYSGGAGDVIKAYDLQVSLDGHLVNPDSINWSAVDVRRFDFRQAPGPRNVLGIVKFRFPNKHDVYMHDTPERNLFNAADRAFSHGCMRVQNPIHLAQVLLGHDKGWSAEKVQGYAASGGADEIKLSTPIPVHVAYFTLTVDDDGHMRSMPDIYGLDDRVATALEGHTVHIAAEPVAPVRTAAVERPAGVGKAPSTDTTVRAANPAARTPVRRQAVTRSPQAPSANLFDQLFGN